MFFEHGQLAIGPGFTHQAGERRHQVGDEAFQSHHQQRLRQAAAQHFHLVGLAQVEVAAQIGMRQCAGVLAATGLLGHGLQLWRTQLDNPAGAETEVDQALDQAQFLHLLLGVQAFAVAVALRAREVITALPDPQGFFGHAGVTLDVADRTGNGQGWGVSFHGSFTDAAVVRPQRFAQG